MEEADEAAATWAVCLLESELLPVQQIQAAVLWKGPLSRTWETLGTRGFLIGLPESRKRGTGNFHRPWQTPAIPTLLEEFCFLVSD